jgi:hypothetical protein
VLANSKFKSTLQQIIPPMTTHCALCGNALLEGELSEEYVEEKVAGRVHSTCMMDNTFKTLQENRQRELARSKLTCDGKVLWNVITAFATILGRNWGNGMDLSEWPSNLKKQEAIFAPQVNAVAASLTHQSSHPSVQPQEQSTASSEH